MQRKCLVEDCWKKYIEINDETFEKADNLFV